MPFLLLLLFIAGFACPAHAHAIDEAEFLAANELGEEIAIWLDKIDPRPNSIALFYVHPNSPLDGNYAAVVEAEVTKQVKETGSINLTTCFECRTPIVTVRDERLVVTKGAPDAEAMKALGKKLGVEAFLTLDLFRTKIAVIAQATIYTAGSGQLVAAERFRIPAVSIADSAAQFMVSWGPGFALSGGGQSDNLPSAVNITLLEELGFGKGGLNVGAAFVGPSANLIYLDTELGFRGRFGTSGVTYLGRGGAGFGFSDSAKGIAARASFDAFIGSYAFIGVEGDFLIPLKQSGNVPMYAGAHIGLSLGR